MENNDTLFGVSRSSKNRIFSEVTSTLYFGIQEVRSAKNGINREPDTHRWVS